MASLTLRLKTKDGQQVLNTLTNESTVKELKKKISELTKISTKTLKVLKGFPPQLVNLTNDQASLKSLDFSSGDTLIIQEDLASQKKQQEKTDNLGMHMILQNERVGFLKREVVPANNSCLFTSVNFVIEGKGKLDLESAAPMRELIAGVVMSDPETYNEAILGKSNENYCQWIMDKESWGGAIELSILSKYYGIEIDVVDTQSTRINRFGEDQSYLDRVLLIYDGIHYDPLAMESPELGMSLVTKFSTSDDTVLQMALEIASEAKSSRQYTDVTKFNLKCLVCGKGLKGQTEAQIHAKESGHINFGEY